MSFERLTKESIEYEIERIENEISDLEDEKRGLQEALLRDEDENGTVAVGRVCEICADAEYRRFPFCPNCGDKIDRLTEQGFTPSKIAQFNVRLEKCIEVYLARQKGETQ